ncbi:hypothetical protein BN173_230004 [Clostridioides difficile T11]|nr:hypothetical protein BN173_230004 [Clostridioides difficile T11]CCL31039.1 hypothetical protein BN174_230004 [Clostridioides difficile E15]
MLGFQSAINAGGARDLSDISYSSLSLTTSAMPAMICSAQGKAIAFPNARHLEWSLFNCPVLEKAVQLSGSPIRRSHSTGVR